MNTLPTRTLGRTGLEVTQLGFGTAQRGRPEATDYDAQVEAVLNAALDAGINFIDTAPDYGASEERIAKFIGHRRDEFYLATKCGCNIDDAGNGLDPGHLWTPDRVRRNIDQSLTRLRTDHVELVQMHGPTVDEVEQAGLVEVLQEIRDTGKTRFIGVSTLSPHFKPFVEMGAFDAFQVPYSAIERCDENIIQQAAEAGAGIVIRGGIGQGHRGSQDSWSMWDKAGLDELADGMNRYEFVLRFTLTHPACHTTIVGTIDLDHLKSNVAAAQAGPLPADIYAEAKARLSNIGEDPEMGGSE